QPTPERVAGHADVGMGARQRREPERRRGGRDVAPGRAGADARQLAAVLATGSYFELLGVRPAMGRLFGEEDDAPPAGAPVAVVSHAFWRRELGADPAALGRELRLDGGAYTLVGVTPPGFTGDELAPADVWLPLHAAMAGDTTSAGEAWDRQRGQRIVHALVRLRPGADSAAAVGRASLAYRRAMAGAPNADSTAQAVFRSLVPGRGADGILRQQGRVALWLQGVASAALLIAVANVTNLLLLRAARRRRETAVRLALGAGRARLAGRALAEGLMLAALAGAAALAIGAVGGRLLRVTLLPDLAADGGGSLDPRAAVATLVITLALGLLTGLVPALARDASAASLSGDLSGGARNSGGTRQSRLRRGLVVAQVALSAALLVGAGLFVRSLRALRSLDFGMDPERVLVARVDLEPVGLSGPGAEAFYERARERVAALPGVASAAVGLSVPFSPSLALLISVPGLDAVPGVAENGRGYPTFYAISPGYLATLGTRLVRGRDFTAADRAGAPFVMLVDETIARRFWPGRDAIGKCIRVGTDTAPCREVVGVVESSRRLVAETEPAMRYYIPAAQSPWRNPPRHLFVRVADGRRAEEVIPAVRREVAALAPNLPFVQLRVLQELVENEVRPWRLGSTMFTLFGALALLIASVGLYGALAYAVAQRTREIGIRMAVGARRGDIVRLVLVDGVRAALLGLGVGGVLALAAGRWIAPLLFQTSPRDPLVLGAVAAALTAVAVVASAIPAWRASRVQPTVALRSE
ncbi:MAG TPA: ADOP family duplicated permease, partial [Gemmatimonadaceae bacterium]|nr:ADOP family duplicated permease [Gemmatimonadaceae bacterium]